MSDLELYQFPEDIRNEFRVDEQGRVFAKSISAISRICGCSESSVRYLLEKLARGGEVSDPLKRFKGKDFRLAAEYIDQLVGAMARHFAYYAQETNDKARSFATLFDDLGTRVGLQQLLGWKNPNVQNDDMSRKLDLLFEMVVKQGKQIDEMQGMVKNINNIEENLPGIGLVIHANNNLLLPANFPLQFFAREWALIMENHDLTNSECQSFGRALAEAFRFAKLENPEKYGAKAIYEQKYAQIARTTYRGWKKAWDEKYGLARN